MHACATVWPPKKLHTTRARCLRAGSYDASKVGRLEPAHLHFQGGREARNSKPVGSEADAVGPAAAPLVLLKPWAANPPGLVAPSAYFSCSVTHWVWVCRAYIYTAKPAVKEHV